MGTGTLLPKFEDALDVTPLDDGRNWLVKEPFYYDTDVQLAPCTEMDGSSPDHVAAYIQSIGYSNRTFGYRIIIPAGFVTDFASVPRFFWRLIPPTGRYTRAAVVHDFLYRTPRLCTRAQADAVLYEAMKFPCHVGFFTRWTIYAGVRLGGAHAYQGGL